MSKRRSRKWFIILLAMALFCVAFGVALSRAVASNRSKQYLTARLEQAFGRSVEVSNFGVRWIPTPAIVANRVTISEDPRFGHEYFLRAENIAASPRWLSLFSGKLEVGTIDLSHPSLNLVRDDDGRWNVESWLPSPANSKSALTSSAARSPRPAAQLSRIEIDGGRINFSRGADRRPFALEELTGSIEHESAGRWRIALAAHPSRAAVHLQDSGTLSVAGVIAGTSARLHPASIELTWSEASLADTLRLAMGNDPGVRGEFALQVKAQTESETGPQNSGATPAPARWNISFSAQVSGLHRWDMAARSDNPSANIVAEAEWDAGSPQITLRNLSLSAPHSKIEATGAVGWAAGINPDVHVTSSGISFEDIFAWYRSFQPGVADGLTADGFLTADMQLTGSLLSVRSGKILSSGARISRSGLTLVNSGLIDARFDSDFVEMLPVIWTFAASSKPQPDAAASSVTIPASAGTIAFHAKLFSPLVEIGKPTQTMQRKLPSKNIAPPAWNYDLALRGDFTRFEDFLNAARLIGRPLNAGWQVEGGLTANLEWLGKLHEHFAKPTGEVSPRGMTLKLPLINQSLEIENAKIELKPGEPHITIVKASALGAHWQGTIWRSDVPTVQNKNASTTELAQPSAAPEWEFDLATDHLDAAELDRWIGPRARPNWLARIFTPEASGNSTVPGPGPLSQLRAHGTLRAETFTLAPLEVQSLRAQIEMLGRNINFSEFDAKLNGGTISGGLAASLEADPIYHLHAAMKDVNVAELARTNPDLRDRLTGQLSGEVKLSFHGIGREQLLDTLRGEGHLSATQFAIRGVDLSAPSANDAEHSASDERFSLV
ncbi:MAG TPA: AsmA family protein, partial [Candidatus Acidoferrales bacterium]